jgi:hypothetical protein
MSWDFDGYGHAFVVSKDVCKTPKDVLDLVKSEIERQPVNPGNEHAVEEGWCKFQCRSDWSDGYAGGGYVVVDCEREFETTNALGKRTPGWFRVWYVRHDVLIPIERKES